MRRCFEIADSRVRESENPESPILLFVNPDETERRFLIDMMQVDEHTLNSALDPDELSRIEVEPNHIAIIYKHPKSYSGDDSLLFRVSSAGLFLFENRLILVMSDDVPVFDRKLFVRVNSLRLVMLKVLYRSIFHYLEHLKIINSVSDELEKKINTSMDNRYIINLFALEKSLVYYLNSINSNGALIEKLKNSSLRLGFTPDDVEFLDDMAIENTQCYKQADIYSSILASMMDARASLVSNNLNLLMKTLNIITIGIMVPTFIVSAFSMNVPIPLNGHPSAFWIILGLATLSVILLMLVWKRKKW